MKTDQTSRPKPLPSIAEDAASWELRAREAEAEAAALRWELTVIREARLVVVERLEQLENRPHRRVVRLVRGAPRTGRHLAARLLGRARALLQARGLLRARS